jgi:aspartate-semialdehyde dehydrogenase
MPNAVFRTQAAFNLFAHPDAGAHPSLQETEARIVRHFRSIVRQELSTPAVLLVQVPVFHGYTIAMFLQMGTPVTAAELESALEGAHITVTSGQDEVPSNANVAGSSEILASVRPDEASGSGFWLFAACDNIRVSAIQALECAEEMVQTRPRGKLQ